ncbi:MAG: hypothetical protein ACR2LT_04450 [Pyrinomonadaceae bacterium]
MKKFYLILVFALLLSVTAFAQKPKPAPKKTAAVKPKPVSNGDEKEEFEKAAAQTDLTQKIAALQKFAADFPQSAEKTHALELVVSTRAQLADEKLRAGETATGIEFFKQAVADAPSPLSDKLFSEVVLQFPTNLFYGGQREAAVEINKAIEEKIGSNAKQILGLATFYLGTENASEARRLAEKAIAIDPQLPVAYQTLGLANRLDFQLDEAVAAYTKAAELDPDSVVSKRSLAEMKRAVGKPSEAAAIYRELITKNADDVGAQTGLILSLFDSEKQAEAEAEMTKSLEKNPNNLFLLTSAGYWYAGHENGTKAVEYAQQAVAIEPRYTWAHIALARGFLLQNQFTEAEKQMLLARQYGNFPTLNYELAAVRLAAGFYGEAARELEKSFTLTTNNSVQTKLGNRVLKDANNFIELLALERRASIFEPLTADSSENADKLKALLILNQSLASDAPKTEEIEQAVNDFVKGDDKAKTHRQLYAADRLLEAKKDLPEVLKLTQAAVGGVDAALDVPNAVAAVLADELIESRRIAISRGEVVIVPDVPRQTLSAILRGRIEEISGWTLFNQDKPQEAVVRLKRAVSILPEKSAWWRSSMWRLGAAFDASGKPAEALDAYTRSYLSAPPDAIKYSVIQAVYQKVNGSLDGLDKKIGAKPVATNIVAAVVSDTTVTTTAKTEPSPIPVPTENAPDTTPITTPTPETTPEVSPTPKPEIAADTKQETVAQTNPPAKMNTAIKNKISEPTAKPAPTPLFDSIVITVPKTETAKNEQKSENKPSDETSEKSKDSTPIDDSGDVRSRIIAASNTENCLNLSQDSITILANGGNLGILVGFQDGGGDLTKITALSGSPTDVAVSLDPDIKSPNRAFFIIKSISTNTGIFTVTFAAPCGKKELRVKVR